jgi:hypothetical protein
MWYYKADASSFLWALPVHVQVCYIVRVDLTVQTSPLLSACIVLCSEMVRKLQLIVSDPEQCHSLLLILFNKKPYYSDPNVSIKQRRCEITSISIVAWLWTTLEHYQLHTLQILKKNGYPAFLVLLIRTTRVAGILWPIAMLLGPRPLPRRTDVILHQRLPCPPRKEPPLCDFIERAGC